LCSRPPCLAAAPFQDMAFDDFHLPLFECAFAGVVVGGGVTGVVTGWVSGVVTGEVTGVVTGGVSGVGTVSVGGGDGGCWVGTG
jgi:hypothetical protein